MPDTRTNPDALKRESRRRFIQFLAGSPLLAAAYPALPASWQTAVAQEAKRKAKAASICSTCGQPLVAGAPGGAGAQQDAIPDPNRFLEGQMTGQVIDSPELAVNLSLIHISEPTRPY